MSKRIRKTLFSFGDLLLLLNKPELTVILFPNDGVACLRPINDDDRSAEREDIQVSSTTIGCFLKVVSP